MKGSFRAKDVPPKIKRDVDIHLMSNVFIINYTIGTNKSTIKNNCTLIHGLDIITVWVGYYLYSLFTK